MYDMMQQGMQNIFAREVWRRNAAIRSILQGGRKTSRAQLEEEFEAMVKMVMKREEVHGATKGVVKTSTADANAGEPCNLPLESLKPIGIDDLVPGRRHVGNVLWVENVGGACPPKPDASPEQQPPNPTLNLTLV